jgi:hypothetical protein
MTLAIADLPGDAETLKAMTTLAAWWAHLRRRFYELHVADVSRIATGTGERISVLSDRSRDPRKRSGRTR